jgi:hypothetical protein
MNRAIARQSSPIVASLEHACHAGGRGFESRRSRLLKCLAVLDARHLKARQGNVQAASELRGWYDQALRKPGESSPESGDRACERASLMRSQRKRPQTQGYGRSP